MRLSCNGCRVLRKGCSDTCCIRPCLDWIPSPDAQANSTLFLAKFYGRAGLLNLLNSGPPDLRPAIFKSLLYEACGRIVNPIYGSVGLLWTGSWSLCQAAVESVLQGTAIEPIPTEEAVAGAGPNLLLPFKAGDIRHVSKAGDHGEDPPPMPMVLHKPARRARFKRTGRKRRGEANSVPKSSSGSGLSHRSESDVVSAESVETEGLDLTLGFGFGSGAARKEKKNSNDVVSDEAASAGELLLGLALAS